MIQFVMFSFQDILKQLQSDDKKTVFRAVNAIAKPRWFMNPPPDVLAEFIKVVENCEYDETNAPLWSIFILGERRVKEAIPALLDVFYTDADFWCEASMDALKKIAETYPDDVFEAIKDWVDKILHKLDDPDVTDDEYRKLDIKYSGRVHTYGVLDIFAPREDVKHYLMTLIERDQGMGNSVHGSLLHWPLDEQMRSFFRRHVELALVTGGPERNTDYIESKWSLIHTMRGETGERRPYARDKMKSLDDWGFVFEYGDEEEDEDDNANNNIDDEESEDDVEPQEIEEQDSEDKDEHDDDQNMDDPEINETITKVVNPDVWANALETKRDFESFELPSFNVEEWVHVRPRSPREQKVQSMLEYYGVTDTWNVDSLQVLVSRAKLPSEIQKPMFERIKFKDIEEARAFGHVFQDLWNFTPREEFNGLTPDEKMFFASVVFETKNEVGRNDPCQCGKTKEDGTPVKYKRCCGK